MPTPEQLARRKIDKRLRYPLLGWEVIPWTKDLDTSSLAAQAVSAISAFETPEGLKLDKDYEVYSQKFRREDLEDVPNFDPKVLPEEYLTKPQEKHTFIYLSTIQRMAINLLGKEALGNFDYEAVKIKKRNYNLDITWLKDDNLENPNSLPEPQILASDTITELNACVNELQEMLGLIDSEEGE